MVSKVEYEGALGAYLIEFNRLEVKLSEVHFAALHRMGLDHLFRPEARLVERLVPMEIALAALDWPRLDYKGLKQINARRNEIAHGHLHTDPYTGELMVEGVHRITRAASTEFGLSVSRQSKVAPPDMEALSREATAIHEVFPLLDACIARFWFEDEDVNA